MAKGIITAVLLALCLCSCKTLDLTYVKKSEIEKEIATLRSDFAEQVAKSNREISEQKDRVIAAKDAQIQAAADALYGQSIVFKTIIEPTRTDLVLMNLSEEAWGSVNHLLPTYAQMVKINDRIAAELDATRTTLADLKRTHDAVMVENRTLVQAEKDKETELARLERAKSDAQLAFNRDVEAKQAALIEQQDEINAKEKARADATQARQAQLAKLSWGAGILAVCALAAALFSPVFKTELGIGAIVLGGAAAALPFVEAWMVLAAFGAIAAGLIIWILYRHHNVDKTNTALVNGLHEIETTNKAQYDAVVAPTIAEFTTKYVKAKDGTVTTVPDASITAQIDGKLMASDRK